MTEILLVEDKDSLRQMLRLTLENAGYTVDEARDGAEARRKLQDARYKLVITDLKMPRADGRLAARRIRHRQRTLRARHSSSQPATQRAVCCDQLRGDSRHADRERIVRPRKRRLHRRGSAACRQIRVGIARHDLP